MAECVECAAAQRNPWSPVYMAGCRGCMARSISWAPEMRREFLLAALPYAEEREGMLAEARAEWRRRKAWEQQRGENAQP